jgi:exodeoxyribonuclease VII small subunit
MAGLSFSSSEPIMSKAPLFASDLAAADASPRATVVADAPSAPAPIDAPIPFEEALEELESIVERMEDGTLSLDQSLAAYRRGAALVKVCETALEHVKEQVRVLDGELLRPLADAPSRGLDRG